mmetsp:Transcript_13812/g.15543  ORF Transcript_13812/g.15543 Transcript_13812/m.15543 type:complete len:203 (+) Transcript_13812:277-885(+)
MCSISLFPITSHAPFMASVAAVFTCFLVSHMHAVTSGTISGRALPSCLGAFLLKQATHFNASSRMGHLTSTGRQEKIAGKRLLIAYGQIFSQMAIAVSVQAFLTSGFLEPASLIHSTKHSLLKASASGAPSATALAVARAASDSLSSLDAILAQRALIFDAKPDFSTPSALMASTTEASSPSDKFANLDSRDIFYQSQLNKY